MFVGYIRYNSGQRQKLVNILIYNLLFNSNNFLSYIYFIRACMHIVSESIKRSIHFTLKEIKFANFSKDIT